MSKKKSFVKEILLFLLILTALMTGVLGIFLASSYNILENEIKASSDAFLKIYSNEFSNNIADMDGLLKGITSQGEDLAKIKSPNGNKRSLASISLYNYMQKLIAGKDSADVIVVYDKNYGICLDAIVTGFNFNKKIELRDFTSKAIGNQGIDNYEWNFLNLDNETYLYKMLITDSRVIAIYIRTGKLLKELSTQENGNRSIVLVNDAGVVGRIWGEETEDIKIGTRIRDIQDEDYYRVSKDIVENQLSIFCYASKNSIFLQTDTSMIIVAIIASIALFFILFILGFTRKEIATPMQHMIKDMEIIKNGDYRNRVSGQFHTKEFQMLQEATNQMVDEIVGLKIQTYEKRIELQDMELKSIRLQLKPHFFLNALTTISSLSSQSKNEHIKIYIDALSKNVRYMFRAGFHTVPVKEEIKHVKNYFEMQELKYPSCIFYLIDLPQELEEWKIPQMLIHTFIENEYKYAVSIGETLTILIKISCKIHRDQEMLLIEIEDDGKGYPVEVLNYMSNQLIKRNEKGTRIGLWSIKRMMELMYELEDLVILENIEPHGCLNKIYVPKNTKHELPVELLPSSLD